MELWDKVCKTDPKHTKPTKIGGMNITAIAPQYQIMNATKAFGPYGIAWGFKAIELDYSLIAAYDLVIFKGTFFCPKGEFQIINSSKMHMDRAKKMVDADFAKKIETDAMTKALSKMGFNADVFMGCFDDVAYVANATIEFAEPVPLSENDKMWIGIVKADPSRLKEIIDSNHKAFIKQKAGV
tara:strand:- start:436 stop:984 length:549 start_codon:yes stop_codon:yes gene_type:complete